MLLTSADAQDLRHGGAPIWCRQKSGVLAAQERLPIKIVTDRGWRELFVVWWWLLKASFLVVVLHMILFLFTLLMVLPAPAGAGAMAGRRLAARRACVGSRRRPEDDRRLPGESGSVEQFDQRCGGEDVRAVYGRADSEGRIDELHGKVGTHKLRVAETRG